MPEVANPCKDHCDTVLIRGGDALGVLDASTRLDDPAQPRLMGEIHRVAKRKERVADQDAVADRSSGLLEHRKRARHRETLERLDAIGLTLARADQLVSSTRATRYRFGFAHDGE